MTLLSAIGELAYMLVFLAMAFLGIWVFFILFSWLVLLAIMAWAVVGYLYERITGKE
jgi:hypothetical protein